MTYLIHRTADYSVIIQSFFLICCLLFTGIPVTFIYLTICAFIGITVFRREFPNLYENFIKIMVAVIGVVLFLQLIRLQRIPVQDQLLHFRAVFDT